MKIYITLTFLIFMFFLDINRPVVAAELPNPDKDQTEPIIQTTDVDNENEKQANQTLDSMFSLYQPYLKNISAYEPIYFLVGVDPSESRFQFSFKYRFLNPEYSVAEKYHWVHGFHLAYTQTSFWDLKKRSQPFKDTSYKPELFFLTQNILNKEFGFGKIFFQTGYQHESNGRDADLSRSTNYLYLKSIFIIFNKKTNSDFNSLRKFGHMLEMTMTPIRI